MASLLSLNKLQCVVGVGGNESGNETDRREWYNFLLSCLMLLLSLKDLGGSRGLLSSSLDLIILSLVYGAGRKISCYMDWCFCFSFFF